MIVCSQALRTLALLKLRGGGRRQLSKLKTVSGCLYATVGGLLGFGWIFSLIVGRKFLQSSNPDPETVRNWTQFGLGVFLLVTSISAASVRGVYLPKQDIERLFSSPVSRSDLVRYRMMVDMVRTLFGALVLALITFHRMPSPFYGFLGVVVSVLTLGIVRQAISLVLGSAKSRLGNFLRHRRVTVLRVLMGIGVWVMLMAVLLGGQVTERLFGDFDALKHGDQLFVHPVVRGLLLPMRPWANMMAATSLADFLAWSGTCICLGLVMFEFTARLPIDYRQQSLETSEAFAKQMSRVRRGGLFTGGKASRRTAGWHLPRLFGRGPMGALAWVKFISVVRKARGTLLVGVLIVTLVTVGITVLFKSGTGIESNLEMGLGSSGMIGLLSIAYLGGALRFDFRSDLDHMVQVKSWPVSSVQIFVGTILPQVLLISGLVSLAIITRMIVTDSFHPEALVIPVCLPFVTFAWLAVDNAVFLFAPVRFVPGQEGSLHHTGRAIVLLALRLFLVAVIAGIVAAMAVIIISIGPQLVGISMKQAGWISAGFGFIVLLVMDGCLAWFGGRMLRRFDVARDRG